MPDTDNNATPNQPPVAGSAGDAPRAASAPIDAVATPLAPHAHEPEPAQLIGADHAGAATRAAPSLPRTTHVAGTTDVDLHALRPMVADLRQKLSAMAAQEIELQRREAMVSQQLAQLERRAREAAARELDAARNRLEQRNNELDAQAIELAARRSQLERFDNQLSLREQNLEQGQRELERTSRRLHERIDSDKQQRATDRQILANRIRIIREREADLERRVKLARDEIVAQRTELDARLAKLEQRTDELETRRNQLAAQESEWQRRLAGVDAKARELEELRDALTHEKDVTARRGHEHRAAQERLEAERGGLADRQRELDEQWRQTRDQRSKALRQIEDLAARQRALQDERNALDARAKKLDTTEHQLARRAAALADDAKALETRIAELEERGKRLDERELQIAALQREADHIRDEALQLREQVESRDAQTRQAALGLEVETQNLDRDRALLEQQYAELADLRDQRDQDLQRATTELDQRDALLRKTELAWFRGTKRWPLRAAVLSIGAGLAASLIAVLVDPASYSARATLRVASGGAPERVAAEHAARLLTPGLLEGAIATPESAQRVGTALRANRLSAHPDKDGTLVLDIADHNPAEARLAATDAAHAYETLVNNIGPTAVAPKAYADLEDRKAEVTVALEKSRTARADVEAQLAKLAELPLRDALDDEVTGLRRRHQELATSLNAARENLAAALSGGDIRGEVTDEDREKALRSDDVYQEDTKEFRLAARDYQSQLAVAMVLMIDPLQTLRDAAHHLTGVVAEQRELSPPVEIAAALEALSRQLSQFEDTAAKFGQDWDAARQGVERLRVAEDVVELVQQQTDAAQNSRHLAQTAQDVRAEIQKQIDAIGSVGSGGTREIVITSVLRSELAKFDAAVEGLKTGVDAADTTTNFELDARDKKVRGLRTRMTQRRAAVDEQLQSQADLAAQQDRGTQTEALRVRVRSLEQERDDVIALLVQRVDAVRMANDAATRKERLTNDLELRKQEESRLTAQLAQLDQAIGDARRSGPAPDRIEDGDISITQIGGLHRERNATLSFIGAAAATWLIAILLLLRNPLRRINIAPALLALRRGTRTEGKSPVTKPAK